jgi:hypothetical protein
MASAAAPCRRPAIPEATAPATLALTPMQVRAILNELIALGLVETITDAQGEERYRSTRLK